MKLCVWIIEGDDSGRHAMCTHLRAAGMEVWGVAGAAELHTLVDKPPHVVVCSTHLPQEGGLSLAASLRTRTSAGVILLTDGDRRTDRLLGLSLGVDHCLARPVELRELELLIRNLHQRLNGATRGGVWPVAAAVESPEPDDVWSFDVSRWRLLTPTGRNVELSLAEHLVLGRLLAQVGSVVNRDDLLTALTGRKISIYSRNLDMIVSRLRKKVERGSRERLPILSARGVGYVFTGRCKICRDDDAPASSRLQEFDRRSAFG